MNNRKRVIQPTNITSHHSLNINYEKRIKQN